MEQSKIEISQANRADLPSIRTFLVERAAWLAQKGINQWQQFANYDQTEQIEHDYERGVLYTAKIAGVCVGAIVITPPQAFDEALWENPEGYLYIHRYVVTLAVQGQGIGEALLRFAQQMAARQEQGLRLDCRANNQALIDYYRKQNLNFCGERNGYARFQFLTK